MHRTVARLGLGSAVVGWSTALALGGSPAASAEGGEPERGMVDLGATVLLGARSGQSPSNAECDPSTSTCPDPGQGISCNDDDCAEEFKAACEHAGGTYGPLGGENYCDPTNAGEPPARSDAVVRAPRTGR